VTQPVGSAVSSALGGAAVVDGARLVLLAREEVEDGAGEDVARGVVAGAVVVPVSSSSAGAVLVARVLVGREVVVAGTWLVGAGAVVDGDVGAGVYCDSRTRTVPPSDVGTTT